MGELEDSVTMVATEQMDPFQDRRLSEVVAQILDSGNMDDVDSDEDDVTDDTPCEHYISFIDYKQEPRNKDLFRGPLKTIQEEGSLSNISGATSSEYLDLPFMDDSVNSSRIDLRSTTDDFDVTPKTGNDDRHHVYTTNVTNSGIETEFGVKPTSTSRETLFDVHEKAETEENKDKQCRWSVTSV